MRVYKLLAVAMVAGLIFSGCGGSGSGTGPSGGNVTPSSGSNTVPIIVDAGPSGLSSPATNIPYVSVEICAPGSTSVCQTIDHISLDTGSSGLRILSSALNSTMVTALQQQPVLGPGGNPLVECAQFVSFFTWGPVRKTDIKMAGETAGAVPIQVIGDPTYSTIPGNCSSSAPASAQDVNSLAANGILGVGLFRQDCGGACTTSTNNPAFYYECSSGTSCAQANASLGAQVANPVWMFSSDNNGVLISLPAIAATGAINVSGTMAFGIGTQSNNGLGNATVFTLAADGTFTTIFNGKSYPESFIDSGSNGNFFLTSALTGIPECSSPNTGFYCPNSTQNLSATNQGLNSVSNTVQFSVANLNSLSGNNTAFNDIGGTNAGPPPSFDWGLPFFFGRNVFTAIEGQNTPAGIGPFWAY